MKFLEFTGTLTTFYETGMEHLGLGLNLESPQFKDKNPNYGPKNPKEPEYFYSYEALILLKRNDRIEIEVDGTVNIFHIGNRNVAQSHGYKFGEAYPLEFSLEQLDQWIKLFHKPLKAKIIRPIKTVAFYGGTFDPLHVGHKAIIQDLHYRFDEVCVLPTNNYTKKNFLFPIENRIKAAQAVANNFNNVKVLDWSLFMETSKTYEMFLKLKNMYGIEPVIVIGSDNLQSINQWLNFSELQKCPFLIFNRGEEKIVAPLENYQVVNNFNYNVSSSNIKKSQKSDEIPSECHIHYDLKQLKKVDF